MPSNSCSACIPHAYHPCATHACMPHRFRMHPARTPHPSRMYAACLVGILHADRHMACIQCPEHSACIARASSLHTACIGPGYCMHPAFGMLHTCQLLSSFSLLRTHRPFAPSLAHIIRVPPAQSLSGHPACILASLRGCKGMHSAMLIDVVRSIVNLCAKCTIPSCAGANPLARAQTMCSCAGAYLLYLAECVQDAPSSPRESGFPFHCVWCCSLLQPLLRRCCTGAVVAGRAMVTAQGKLTARFAHCSCASAVAQSILSSGGPLNAVGRQCAECCGILPHLPCPTHPQPSEHGFLHSPGRGAAVSLLIRPPPSCGAGTVCRIPPPICMASNVH